MFVHIHIYFSSIGPTYDGRLKPDIIAPGNSLESALSSGVMDSATCATTSMSGEQSMA